MKKIVVTAVLACIAGASLAQQALKPEEMIKYRKAGYNVMAWNMGKIRANLDGTFDKNQVAAAANAIAAIANSGTGALFGPGSEKDVGDQKTRVNPDFFKQPDKMREVGVNFSTEATKLAQLAAGDDVAAIKAQFGKTGAACKTCHDISRKN